MLPAKHLCRGNVHEQGRDHHEQPGMHALSSGYIFRVQEHRLHVQQLSIGEIPVVPRDDILL